MKKCEFKMQIQVDEKENILSVNYKLEVSEDENRNRFRWSNI